MTTAGGALRSRLPAIMSSGIAPPASVIVRTSDSASTVGALLDDLERQTIRPEIVVVDSGSSDRTLELVASAHIVVALGFALFGTLVALPVRAVPARGTAQASERWVIASTIAGE